MIKLSISLDFFLLSHRNRRWYSGLRFPHFLPSIKSTTWGRKKSFLSWTTRNRPRSKNCSIARSDALADRVSTESSASSSAISRSSRESVSAMLLPSVSKTGQVVVCSKLTLRLCTCKSYIISISAFLVAGDALELRESDRTNYTRIDCRICDRVSSRAGAQPPSRRPLCILVRAGRLCAEAPSSYRNRLVSIS